MTDAVVVPARAALAGNPSDGYGGAVCSVIVPFLAATASVASSPGPVDGSGELTDAVRRRFAHETGVDPAFVRFETSIPRSVGLAGSSAIVIATLRALADHHSIELTDMQIAEFAHAVERSDLGIPGGWQDQLIQSHGVSSLMEFGDPFQVTPLRIPAERPVPLYLAWSEAAAEASGSSHRTLRAERSAADSEMRALASLARDAAAAIEAGSIHDLKAAIDETFDIRKTLMRIPEAQSAMVECARSLGASANFAGSGGAIIGVLPKSSESFVSAMTAAELSITTWEAT